MSMSVGWSGWQFAFGYEAQMETVGRVEYWNLVMGDGSLAVAPDEQISSPYHL